MAAAAEPRRWTINGDFTRLRPTGVARYACEVVHALDALCGARHPLARGMVLDVVTPAPLELQHLPIRLVAERGPRLPQRWVQTILPRHAPGGLLSLCNLAPVAHPRHIACIHDLQTYTRPESFDALFRLVHRIVLPRVGASAALITTVSEHSRAEIVAYGVAPADKIAVTYNGADHARRWQADRSHRAFGRGRPYVLAMARGYRYKNDRLLIDIAAGIASSGVDMLVAGGGTIEPPGRDRQLPGNLELLGFVGDDELAALYRDALAFLFPSRTEGFGLPAVEAMTLGCPVIASTAPSLPEVCGDAALYASPDDAAAWIDGVLRLHHDRHLREELREAGRQRAGRYTWQRIGEIYLELMARVDAGFDREAATSRPGRLQHMDAIAQGPR